MSLGDDHGYGAGDGGHGDSAGRGRGAGGTSRALRTPGEGQTRTRFPEGYSDPYTGARRSGRPARGSRSLVTVVGVIVLLIAAIAFANRGTGSGSDSSDNEDKGPQAAPTAATGERPVTTASHSGIPSGFAHDQQGAQSAAANYAVALGSADMFDKARRDTVLEAVIAPSRLAGVKADFDRTYSPAFDTTVGLNTDGSAPQGYTFVSRTTPIGTRPVGYAGDRATVSVWCGGLVGLAGEKSTRPVTVNWFTFTMTLQWTAGDWKIVSHSQKDGPAPIPGDDRASSADEIAKAVEGYGGFTYAR